MRGRHALVNAAGRNVPASRNIFETWLVESPAGADLAEGRIGREATSHQELGMASITERMKGAALLEVATYEEVEADTTATGQAQCGGTRCIASGIGWRAAGSGYRWRGAER